MTKKINIFIITIFNNSTFNEITLSSLNLSCFLTSHISEIPKIVYSKFGVFNKKICGYFCIIQ